MREYGSPLTRILPYKDRIGRSVKTPIPHILCNDSIKVNSSVQYKNNSQQSEFLCPTNTKNEPESYPKRLKSKNFRWNFCQACSYLFQLTEFALRKSKTLLSFCINLSVSKFFSVSRILFSRKSCLCSKNYSNFPADIHLFKTNKKLHLRCLTEFWIHLWYTDQI